MNKSILITGIAGTGKSSVCKEFSKLKYDVFSIEDIKGLFTMINKTTNKPFEHYSNYDLEIVKQGAWVCDKKKLKRLINKNKEGIVFYCGTAENLDDLWNLFDHVFLLQTNIRTLKKRLSQRKSNDFARTKEVQKWVFSGKRKWENHLIKKGAIVIDAGQSLKKIAASTIKKIQEFEN